MCRQKGYRIIAFGAGDVAKINRLIKAGANVNAADKDGEIPLHKAALEGHTDVVITLDKAFAYL